MFKSTSNVACVFYLFTNQINNTYKTAVSLSGNMLIHIKLEKFKDKVLLCNIINIVINVVKS